MNGMTFLNYRQGEIYEVLMKANLSVYAQKY